MISLYQHPWNILTEYQFISRQLKQKDDELPAYVAALTSGTAAYEKQIRQAWEEFKRQPSQEHAREFIDLIKSLSSEHWPEVVAAVLGVPEITDEQAVALQTAIDEHHNFLENSLFPDIVKAVSGKKDLSSLDYRTVFLYAGALWSFGMLATVMFDGLSVRDLADLFMFTGPDDDHTCTGDNGCKRHVGNVYTVAQILAEGIIPGQLRCLTNCRHMLLPIASPLKEKKKKHLGGEHDQRTHAGVRGSIAAPRGAELIEPNTYPMIRRTHSDTPNQVSDNSMYGEGVYFSNVDIGTQSYGGNVFSVNLKPSKQLYVEEDVDVPRVVEEITGLKYYDPKASQAMTKAGIGSIVFPVDEQIYTLVYDVGLIVDAKKVQSIEKHLGGKHDQRTYGRARGGVEIIAGEIRQSDLRADNAKSSEVANTLGAVGKDCYRNSVLASHILGGIYVEGIVIDHKIGFPFEHGWVESEGAIVDPTLILHDDDLSRYSYVPIRKYTNEDIYALMSKHRGKLTLPLLMDDKESAEDIKTAWEYAIGLLNAKTSEKHLPGRHDQQTHAGARGGTTAEGVSIEDLADPNSTVNRQARASWKDLTEDERLALMNPDAVDLAKRRELSRYRGAEFVPGRKLAGKPLDADAVDDITANAHDQIKQLKGALNPVTERLMAEYVDTHIKGALQATIDDGSLKASAEDIDNLVRANVDKLVFQEIESRKRQLGDHGIRHVVTNIENANKMLDELPSTTPMDRLLVAQVMTDHDMGYTAGVVTKSFEATKDHEVFSAKYVEAQDYTSIFGDRAGELQEAVATHAEKDLDWNGKPILSAIRTADNLALFSKEKLPTLFADVPGAMTELYKLQLASKEDGGEVLPLVRDNLRKLVTDSEIDGRQKKELLQAIDEVGPMTPKFTIGMDAGEVTGFKFTKGLMEVDLVSKPERDALNGVFDLGDRQFNKFLEDYDVEGTPADGLELVEKDSGEHVLRMRYNEIPTAAVGRELADLQELSVRPTIRYVVRHMKVPPTQAERDALWPDIDELLRPRTTVVELELFHKHFNDNTLDKYPLTDREHEFIRSATFKELTEFLEKHLQGRHDQRTHTPFGRRGGTAITLGGHYRDIKMQSVFWHQKYDRAKERADKLGAAYVAKYWVGDGMYHVMKVAAEQEVSPLSDTVMVQLGDEPMQQIVIDRLREYASDKVHVDDEVVNSDIRLSKDVQNLGAISARAWIELFEADGDVYLGKGNVTDLDANSYLKGMRPRGWGEGMTWEMVRGAADNVGGGNDFYVGTEGNSEDNGLVALHEAGHALNHVGGEISDSMRWRTTYNAAISVEKHGLSPYLLQEGDVGPSETWAEFFAAVQRSKYVGKGIALSEMSLKYSKAYDILFDEAEAIIKERGW